MSNLTSTGANEPLAGADFVTKAKVVSAPKAAQLTPLAVSKAKLPKEGEPQRILWDAGSGLGLRLNHQSRTWIVQARGPDGKSVRRTVGPADGPDAVGLAAARKQARALRTAIENGEAPAALRRVTTGPATAPAGAPTLRTVRDEYLADQSAS